MKLIRELRWGPPKSFKTGAVVGTYPKPLLYFGFDVDGLSVIPSSKQPKVDGTIPFDIVYEDIVQCQPGQLGQFVTKTEQPKVLSVDYTSVRPRLLTLEYNPSKSQEALQKFQDPSSGDFNKLAGLTALPWKTVVLDGVTGYMEVVLSHFSSLAPGRMADARDWAFQVGQMVKRVMTSITMLPCHVVVLMHDEMDKNELNQMVGVNPYVYGREVRAIGGGFFSQYFHTKKSGTKPVIEAVDSGYVRGIGARWPVLTGETAPDFKSIYGKEL
ncbi:MAG: hypothetical protein KGL39_08490 [Patescibacteria group bacterium]|nr:hypothetical protein [Patescibacteria group bacterium]